jgi:hypothetical protein
MTALRTLLSVLHLDHGAEAIRAVRPEQWPGLLHAATATGTMATLAATAVRAGLIPDPPSVSEGFAAALDRDRLTWAGVLLSTRVRQRQRGSDLLAQGRHVLDALARAAVAAVPLKGLALLLSQVWEPADRSMTDLDILVPPDHLPVARRTLIALGYTYLDQSRTGRRHPVGWLPGDHHDPPMVLPGHPGTVELHRHLLGRNHRTRLPEASVREQAGTHGLSAVDQLAHLAAHAQLTDGGLVLGHAPVRAALDTAHLLRRNPELTADGAIARHPRLANVIRAQVADAHLLLDPRPGPGIRWSLADRLIQHPTAHRQYARLIRAHRALHRQRIVEIYRTPDTLPAVTTARIRHVTRYAQALLAGVHHRTAEPFGFADVIFCLNLDRETERWTAMQKRFATLGIADRVERISAIAITGDQHRGRALTWRLAIERAHDSGCRTALIFDDDVLFLDTTLDVLRDASPALHREPWDLFFLGLVASNHLFPFVPGSTSLQRCGHGVSNTHAVALRRTAMARILADIPATDPDAMDRWCNDWVAIDQYTRRHITAGNLRAVATWPHVATTPALRCSPDADQPFADRYTISCGQ